MFSVSHSRSFHHSSLPLNPLYSVLYIPFTNLLSPFFMFFFLCPLLFRSFHHYSLPLNPLYSGMYNPFTIPSSAFSWFLFYPFIFRSCYQSSSFPSLFRKHTLLYVSPSSVHLFSSTFTSISFLTIHPSLISILLFLLTLYNSFTFYNSFVSSAFRYFFHPFIRCRSFLSCTPLFL